MSTVATETRITRIGVVVALYPSDPSAEMEIQRAPDSSGSPDTANAEIIVLVPAGTRTYTDFRSGGTWHYRIRHVRAGATASSWTRWVAATGVPIPGTLPTIPSIAVPVVEAKAEQTASVGTVTLEITDPFVRVTATAFEPISGGGAFDLSTDPTTWAVFDETDPFTLTDDVTLTGKHTSRIAWAVRYNDPDGNEQWFRGIETMDLDLIAEVTGIEVTFDANGEAVVSATGDEDTANLYVTVGDGTDPADPTVATNDGTISGRSGTVATGAAITVGQDAHVKVVAADSDAVLGPVQSARQRRGIGKIAKKQVVPFGEVVPFSSSTTWTAVGGTAAYMQPGATGSRVIFHGGVKLPAGATITQIEAQLYRTTDASDFAELFFRRAANDQTVSNLADLAHDGTATGWQTPSSALSHVVDGDSLYFFQVALEATNALNDARFAKCIVSYDAADVDQTL